MNGKKMMFWAGMISSFLMFTSCSNDSDPDPDEPEPAPLTITGASPEYTLWGDELTIEGTGFSTVKSENIVTFTEIEAVDGLNPSSDGGDIIITEATATMLKIKVPFLKTDEDDDPQVGYNRYSGYSNARIQVKVKDKTVSTATAAKFVGHPYIRGFNYHYGWYDYANVTRIADSVMINCGFSGSNGDNNAKASGYFNKLRLRIAGAEYPVKHRQIGTNSGWVVFLPLADFGKANGDICDEIAPSGDRGRKMPFEVYVDGTDMKDVRQDMYVLYFAPYSVITPGTGPDIISLLETQQQGTHPAWTVKGKNMFFQTATFTPAEGCANMSPAELQIANPNVFKDEYTIAVPLSLMTEDCTYTIRLKGPCNTFKEVGVVKIVP